MATCFSSARLENFERRDEGSFRRLILAGFVQHLSFPGFDDERSITRARVIYTSFACISWSLFPNYGSHYSPFVTGVLTWLVVIIVILGWDAKTLTRPRYARVTQS